MRILIAEDDEELADGLAKALRQSGHEIEHAADGESADLRLVQSPPELLVLDLGLPKLDGFEVLRRARSRGTPLLILILSAEDEVDARIQGLDLGADDYLSKPFALGELEARIRALARRARGDPPAAPRCGLLEMDVAGKRISAAGVPLDLTRNEFLALSILIERCGKVVPKSALFDRLYEWDSESGMNAVEVCVSRLRRKLDPSGSRIRVVRGLGYLLEHGDGRR